MSSSAELLAIGEKFIPKGYDPTLYRVRHSTAHIMAQAVRERFSVDGDVRIAIGPPIQDGFYYDFQLPRQITDEDLAWVENRIKEIIRGNYPFEVREISQKEARALFKDEPYKLDLIDRLSAGAEDEYGQKLETQKPMPLTVYQHDTFCDLCRGPHVARTGDINPNAIKLLSIAGAYWRGDENQPMLQRIYATAFPTEEELKTFLWRRSEAERRDHRKLGKELDLFHMDQTAPGMAYWLPKGLKVLNTLLDFWRIEHEKRDYHEIASPIINEKRLYEISGHWEHYRDNMFLIPISEHVTYCVKPMNCPNAMVVFNLKVRSYRDLPLRLSDCDILHRHERSGTLHGLMRVQKFQQDDAHLFVTPEQIEEEYDRILEIADLFYGIFGLKYSLRLGTRPEGFMGDIETWNAAEAALLRILEKRTGKGNFSVLEGDGAFYGPKIDIIMEDALGRSWQMGTVQLDFQLPRRFDCKYIDRDGSEKTPVVIHRVIYGSLERFIGLLIEHTAGNFPAWLAPVQVAIIPITDDQMEYCTSILATLRAQGIRAELDGSGERMGAKIRIAQTQKIPYMLVVGKRELAENKVAVRLRNGQDLGAMPLSQFLDQIQSAVAEKREL